MYTIFLIQWSNIPIFFPTITLILFLNKLIYKELIRIVIKILRIILRGKWNYFYQTKFQILIKKLETEKLFINKYNILFLCIINYK